MVCGFDEAHAVEAAACRADTDTVCEPEPDPCEDPEVCGPGGTCGPWGDEQTASNFGCTCAPGYEGEAGTPYAFAAPCTDTAECAGVEVCGSCYDPPGAEPQVITASSASRSGWL